MTQRLLDTLYAQHEQLLGSNLAAIIMCGSASHLERADRASSDIDYIIVLDELSSETILAVTRARQQLAVALNREMSNTVIHISDVKNLNQTYKNLDGKAVQALVEADAQNTRWSGSDFHIPALTNVQLADFAKNNFYILRALLLKKLIRDETDLSEATKVKSAKIGLILHKMAAQSKQIQQSVYEAELYRSLQQLKQHPSSLDAHATLELLFSVTQLLPTE